MRHLLLIALVIASCTKPKQTQSTLESPDKIVKAFVELSAGAKQAGDHQKLADMCAGRMRQAFEKMSADEFKAAYLHGAVKIIDLKILESKVEENIAIVKYQVTVENSYGSDKTQEINERDVALSNTEGQWYLEAIRLKGSDKVSFTRGMIF